MNNKSLQTADFNFMVKRLKNEFEFFRTLDTELKNYTNLTFADSEFTKLWDKAFTKAAQESKNNWLSEFRNGSDPINQLGIDNRFLKEYLEYWRC